jgi:hypothetical protein
MLQTEGQQVLESLKEEAELCTLLAGLREEQRRLIDAGEAEQLLDVLARKQRAINRIGQIEERLRPVKSDWERRRRDYPAAGRVAIGEAFREVRSLLEDLIAKETDDAAALAARKDAAEREIQSFDSKRRIETAYRTQHVGRPESRLIDRKDA